jgi:hypothetical protein
MADCMADEPRKPLNGWVGDGDWEDPGMSVWCYKDGADWDIPVRILSLAPEDVEARRKTAENVAMEVLDAFDITIEYPVAYLLDVANRTVNQIEAAWGLTPKDNDG